MTAPTPREQAAEVLAAHRGCTWNGRGGKAAAMTCGAPLPPAGADLTSTHQAEMLVGLLPDREEWGVLYEADRNLVLYDVMGSEAKARKAVADSPTDTALAHRYVTEWRTA